MVERISQEDVKQAMASFYKGKVNVFEAGSDELMPNRIQDRPFFKLMPEGQTSYVQQGVGGKGSYEVTTDKPSKGSKLETESSQFLEDMEKRFRNVKPEATLIIIDPDVVRGRYAMDDSRDKSLIKTLAHYLQEKLDEKNATQHFPLREEDYQVLGQASVDGNMPLSATQNTNANQMNPYGDGQISIVIGSQPDMPMHDMFTQPMGSVGRMQKEGITGDSVRKMILYHEIGHALDRAERGIPGLSPNTRLTHDRHRTECVADAHAVLQLAKDEGHTKTGELVGDLRADTVMMGLSQLLPQQGVPGMMVVAPPGNDNSPEGNIIILGNDAKSGIKAKGVMGDMDLPGNLSSMPNIFPGMANEAIEKIMKRDKPTTKQGQALQEIEQAAMAHQKMQMIGGVASYNTSPTVDAAVKFAKEKLKDGSLQKMTDKEIHEAADKIVEKTCWSQEQIDNFCFSVLTGQPGAEVQSAYKRAEEAEKRQPELKMGRTIMIMTGGRQGNPSTTQQQMMAASQISPDQMKEIVEWREKVYEEIEKKGGDKEAILKVAAAEKDKVRKDYDEPSNADPINLIKTSIINQELLGTSEHVSDLAKVSATVKTSIQKLPAPKSEKTGEEALVEFVGYEMAVLESAEKGLKKASDRDGTMTMEEIEKSRSSERRNYKAMLKAERAAEATAFKIRKDPEAWKLAQTSPDLAKKIEDKAKQKHPQWMDEYHLNFSNNDKFRVEDLQKAVQGSKAMLAYTVKKAKDVNVAVERNDDKLAKKVKDNIPAQKKPQRIVKRPEQPKAAGNITWNKTMQDHMRDLKQKTR